MKGLIAFILSLLTAKVASQSFLNQSAPFSLVLTSENCTLNGSYLYPCHEGAAIEGLCVTDPESLVFGSGSNSTAFFQFNTTGPQSIFTGTWNPGPTGILTYNLQASDVNVSSPMGISTSLFSNVADLLFTPGGDGSAVEVAFGTDEKMNIQNNVGVIYYRWSACIIEYDDYTYQQLAWLIGSGPPDNPTCQYVQVVRVFL